LHGRSRSESALDDRILRAAPRVLERIVGPQQQPVSLDGEHPGERVEREPPEDVAESEIPGPQVARVLTGVPGAEGHRGPCHLGRLTGIRLGGPPGGRPHALPAVSKVPWLAASGIALAALGSLEPGLLPEDQAPRLTATMLSAV